MRKGCKPCIGHRCVSKPKNFEELAATVVGRVIGLAGLELDGYRWGD